MVLTRYVYRRILGLMPDDKPVMLSVHIWFLITSFLICKYRKVEAVWLLVFILFLI